MGGVGNVGDGEGGNAGDGGVGSGGDHIGKEKLDFGWRR